MDFNVQRSTLNVQRRGVTLIELLIVIVIALIVAGIALAAMFGAPERARVRATEALIAKLDKALAAHLDAFAGDFSSSLKPSSNFPSVDTTSDYARAGQSDAATAPPDVVRRAPVIMRKRMMREQFPERFVEIHSGLVGSPSLWAEDLNDNGVLDAGEDWNGNSALDDVKFPDPNDSGHTGTSTLHPVRSAYLRRLKQSIRSVGASATHTAATESSECLYLILTSAARQGIQVAEDLFKDNVEVRDTDGDGLPEFVDAWGHPLMFFRWPVLNTPSTGTQDTDPDDPNHTLTRKTSDPSDWFTNHAADFEGTWNFHLISNRTPAGSDTVGTDPESHYWYPLIVSAGPDGKFGYYDNGTADPRDHPHERAALVPDSSAVDSEGNSLRDQTFDNITNHQLRAGGTRK